MSSSNAILPLRIESNRIGKCFALWLKPPALPVERLWWAWVLPFFVGEFFLGVFVDATRDALSDEVIRSLGGDGVWVCSGYGWSSGNACRVLGVNPIL